jgi:hypothetical protein
MTRELPVLEEKVKFSEFKGLQMLGKPLVQSDAGSMEMDVKVAPNEEIVYLMRKTGSE